MAISPWHVGQTDPPLQLTCLQDNFTASIPGDLPTDPTKYSLQMQDQLTGVVSVGTGTFDTTQVGTGLLLYTPSNADVAAVGTFRIWVKYTNALGKVNISDRLDWKIVLP